MEHEKGDVTTKKPLTPQSVGESSSEETIASLVDEVPTVERDLRPLPKIFVHIRIPKTASRSLICTLKPTDLLRTRTGNHLNVPDALEFAGIKKGEEVKCRTFSFVRNPYQRLRSAFFHLLETPDASEYMKKTISRLKQDYPDGDFTSFIMKEGFKDYNFPHFQPQTHLLFDQDGKRIVNFIGYHEDLEKDFRNFLEIIEYPDSIKLKKTNSTKHPKYLEPFKWTGPLIQKVTNYYKSDFRLLGYGEDPKDYTPKKKVCIFEDFPPPMDTRFYESVAK